MDIRSVSESAPGGSVQTVRAAPAQAPAPVPTPGATNSVAASNADARPDPQQLGKAVEALNKAVKQAAPGIEFSVESDTHETVVKVVDQSTKEVLRQIPSEETIEIAKALDKLQGLLIRNQA